MPMATRSTSSSSAVQLAALPVRWLQQRWQQMPAAFVGLLTILIYLLLAIFGEAIAPHPYTEQNLAVILQPPSIHHLFGTDQFGRDIFSRVVVGSRSIMLIAGTATLLSLLVGGAVGLVAGFVGGLWDEALMRITDLLLSFPALLLALLIISTLGSDLIYLVLTTVVVFAPGIARVVRSETLNLVTKEFIEAARVVGVPAHRILLYHLLPNLSNLLVVEGSIYFSYTIMISAGLGFLGLGVQPPSPDWGLQINDGRNVILTAWWVTAFPSFAMASLVLGVNLFADGLTRRQMQR